MKRKRVGKRKPVKSPAVSGKDSFKDVVSQNAQDDAIQEDYTSGQRNSTKEIETPSINTNETTVSKKARSTIKKQSRVFSSSSVEPKGMADTMQVERTNEKNSELVYLDPSYSNQEIRSALEVIKKVMKMDAAQPFNIPVDPIALGIPDYLDVIDTPMDFGTICVNLENGRKYKNSRDVFSDVKFIWENCFKYNKKGHYILELMNRVKKNFMKYWTEAGLFMEQPREMEGHPNLDRVEPNVRYNTNEQRSSVSPVADYSRYQYKDQMDPSQSQPRYPPQDFHPFFFPARRLRQSNYGYSHLPPAQPSDRYSEHEFRSYNTDDDQFFWDMDHPVRSQLHQHQPSISSYSMSYGKPYPQQESYRWCSSEESMRRHYQYEHAYPVDPMFEGPTHMQQNRHVAGPSHLHQHLPPSSFKTPSRPQDKSFQSQPRFPRPSINHADDEMDFSSSDELYSSPPPPGSMIRSNNHVSKCTVGPTIANGKHKNQVSSGHTDLRQPSSSYFRPHQPPEEIFPIQPKSSHPRPSHFQADINQEEEQLFTPVDSMIRCSKPRPKSRVGQMNAINKHEDMVASNYGQTHQQVQQSSSKPQSSHPQAGIDKEEENLCSTLPTDSMIRCSKRESKCPVGPMVPQPSQPQAGTDDGGVDIRLPKQKARGRPRGRSRYLEVMNSMEKITVAVNEFGQAIGSEAPKLTSFLGIIARDGNISPLNYVDWRALPDEKKEKMWQDVLSKFEIDPKSKTWVLKSIGKKWKDWKAELKATHYNTHETDEERLADCDERVLPDQWRILVSFWNSQEAKERSARNKASRAHQITSHATGQKSFAQIREEERLKRPDGKAPSRAELYILTRTRKDGRPVSEAASAVISKLREQTAQQQETSPQGPNAESDVFTKVMGQDRHGYVRTYGLGPSPSDLGGPSRTEGEAMKMVSNANAEVLEMKEKMASMEQTCAQMATQMSTMMSIMSDMQKKLSDKDVELPKSSQAADVSVDSGGSVQGVPSNQNEITGSGKAQSTSTSKG